MPDTIPFGSLEKNNPPGGCGARGLVRLLGSPEHIRLTISQNHQGWLQDCDLPTGRDDGGSQN